MVDRMDAFLIAGRYKLYCGGKPRVSHAAGT